MRAGGLVALVLIASLAVAMFFSVISRNDHDENQPTPAPAPPLVGEGRCAQGFYVIDGTNSKPEHNNLMIHLYRWATNKQGCELSKRYYSGIGVVLAEGIDDLYATARRDICQDVLGRNGAPVREVGLAGFSRGAIAAVRLANELRRKGCDGHGFPARIVFVGLDDAVRTTIPTWPGELDPGISHTVHVIKQQRQPGELATWTHRVGNIAATHEIRGMGHGDMNCPDTKPGFQQVEGHLVGIARKAGFMFGDRVRSQPICPLGPGRMARLANRIK